ncbi:MAG: aminotransferase class IV [Planctomycetota bacterium]|jgi:branched-subunit amino acid aminotransferase/4-amino-4-deoxychorismate lyase
MGKNNVYLNGGIIPAEQAFVSISDAGFLHGASSFTTMLAHKGVVFRFDRHLERLMSTVRLLSLRTDAAPEALKEATYNLLAANELKEARLRITLTPGSIGGRVGEIDRESRPTSLITASKLPEYPRNWYEKGISVVVSSFKQAKGDPTFGYKTGCYFTRVLARQEAAAKAADEALWYTPDNYLAESCFCNVFLVLGGKVWTPPRDTPVLPGIVREAVIELCRKLKIECDAETPLTVREMLAAEEMFLTSSTTGLRPVVRVERHPVGDERPGRTTRIIMEAYERLLDQECSPPDTNGD